MQVHQIGSLLIYFGDQRNSVPLQDIAYYKEQKILGGQLLQRPPFALVAKTVPMQSLFFAHQTHGIGGIVVTHQMAETMPCFASEADFVMTDQRSLGLGILTADCTPIILYDAQKNAFAVVHAGWRGAVAGIAGKALQSMCSAYKSDPSDIKVIIGPAARACCYQVGDEVIDTVMCYPWGPLCLRRIGQQTYCDIPLFNAYLLQNSGIRAQSIDVTFSLCTIDNLSFYSHRRQGNQAQRQITLAVLSVD